MKIKIKNNKSKKESAYKTGANLPNIEGVNWDVINPGAKTGPKASNTKFNTMSVPMMGTNFQTTIDAGDEKEFDNLTPIQAMFMESAAKTLNEGTTDNGGDEPVVEVANVELFYDESNDKLDYTVTGVENFDITSVNDTAIFSINEATVAMFVKEGIELNSGLLGIETHPVILENAVVIAPSPSGASQPIEIPQGSLAYALIGLGLHPYDGNDPLFPYAIYVAKTIEGIVVGQDTNPVCVEISEYDAGVSTYYYVDVKNYAVVPITISSSDEFAEQLELHTTLYKETN